VSALSESSILIVLVGLFLVIAGPSGTPIHAAGPEPARHPSLVRADGGSCLACHEDTLKDLTVQHPPAVDDCTTCHEITVTEEGTQIALAMEEPALCLMCHEQWTAAAQGELAGPHYPVTESCVTCHDPHASGTSHLLVAPVAEVCNSCHDAAELNPKHGGQLTAVTDCAACHRPHGSDHPTLLRSSGLHRPFAEGSCAACHRQPFGDRLRLRSRGDKLCTACHGDVAENVASGGTVHAAMRDHGGRAGCLACHDPHMSDNATLLIVAGPDLCRACHSEVVEAARAETGHAAAADDCLTCHRPHVSDGAALLQAPAEELCAMCHEPADSDLAGAHLGADLSGRDCTECHSPHGAGQPKLLARNVHAPVLDGCDTCHEGGWDQVMENGDSGLCLMCHDDIGEQAANATVPHPAMEMARCADCHNPHASAQARLVRLPRGAVCTTCHEEQATGPGEVPHEIIRLVGCEACHLPHGGETDKMLRRTGDDLCLSCHGANSVRVTEGEATARLLDRFEIPAKDAPTALQLSVDNIWDHPVLGHRVKGRSEEDKKRRIDTSFDGELSCLACHDPHKGRSNRLLLWGASSAREACLHCHPK